MFRISHIKKYLGLLTLTIVLTLSGFGCKGLTAEQQASIRPVTLNYWTVYDDVDQLNAFAKAYHTLRPYVKINVRQVRYDEFDSLFTNALADDAGPDIVSMYTRWLSKYESRLASMPESVKVASITVQGQYDPQTIITQETNFMPSQTAIRAAYVRTVPKDIIVGGNVLGLPLALDTLAIYYNKDLLDKAGVPLPPTTWKEFTDAVKKTTKFSKDGKILQSGVALGTGNNIDHAFDILSLLMLQNGVTMTDGNSINFANGLREAGVNHPSLEALRFYTDFARPEKEVYSWNSTMDPALNSFLHGTSVFYFGFAYDAARIRAEAPQLAIEVIPIPQLNTAQAVNVANYWIESVAKKSTHQNEAWDFIRFLSMPDNIKKYTDATHQPSPLRQHIAAQSADPALAPFANSVLVADNWYRGHNFDAANKAFQDLANAYLQPYGENENGLQRDAGLLLQTAAIVQQTM